jgi:hypothetical protein
MPKYTTKAVHPAPICPPGLEATQGANARPPVYVPFSNAATREYADDEGWTYVTYTKKTKSRKWQGARDD